MKTDKVCYIPLTYELAEIIGLDIVNLGVDTPWTNWTVENLLQERPNKWSLSFLATIEDKPIGYVIASSNGKILHVHIMMVDQKWRGLGIGKLLYYNMLKKAEDFGAVQIFGKINRSNQGSIHFHRELGFNIINDKQSDYISFDASVQDVLKKYE